MFSHLNLNYVLLLAITLATFFVVVVVVVVVSIERSFRLSMCFCFSFVLAPLMSYIYVTLSCLYLLFELYFVQRSWQLLPINFALFCYLLHHFVCCYARLSGYILTEYLTYFAYPCDCDGCYCRVTLHFVSNH